MAASNIVERTHLGCFISSSPKQTTVLALQRRPVLLCVKLLCCWMTRLSPELETNASSRKLKEDRRPSCGARRDEIPGGGQRVPTL